MKIIERLRNKFKLDNLYTNYLIYYCFFCIPFILWEINSNQLVDIKSVIIICFNAMLNGFLFANVALLFSYLHKKIFKFMCSIYFILAYSIVLILLGIRFLLNIAFSPLLLNIAFDTTTTEAFEYLSGRMNILLIVKVIIVLIVIFFTSYLFFKTIKKVSNIGHQKKWIFILLPSMIYGVSIFFNDVLYANNMFNEIKGLYKTYADEKAFLQTENLDYLKSQQLAKNINSANTISPQTVVIVIGESLSRNHMSLYGYTRKTNPNLEKIRDEMYIFNNVISPANTTIQSLRRMLTFADFGHEDYIKSPSLLDVINANGYKTWWISNQLMSGIHETWSNRYAQKASVVSFINTTTSWYHISVDENLFLPFQIALDDTAKQKFIILHLIGSHERADKRYPPTFNYFTDTENLPLAKKDISLKTKQYVNNYDNSVLYNDFVMFQLINMLKQSTQTSCLLYTSDHAEELGEDADFHGHNEGVSSRYMCEIPFLFWCNPSFKIKNKTNIFKDYLHRKYQTDDFTNSILDLLNIKYIDFDSSKSIFSPHFIQEKRFVNQQDYDSLFTN